MVLKTCILIISIKFVKNHCLSKKVFYFYAGKTHIGHSERFFEGPSLFLLIWVQIYVPVRPYGLHFCCLILFLLFFDLFFLLFSSYSSLLFNFYLFISLILLFLFLLFLLFLVLRILLVQYSSSSYSSLLIYCLLYCRHAY